MRKRLKRHPPKLRGYSGKRGAFLSKKLVSTNTKSKKSIRPN